MDKMEPEFSREAAQVLNSPYFSQPSPKGASIDDVVAHSDRLDREKALLHDAVIACRTETDLKGEARAIWDRVKGYKPNA